MTDRRSFLALCAQLGIASTVFTNTLWPLDKAAPEKITPQEMDDAAALAGISIADPDKKMLLEGLEEQRKQYEKIHDLQLANSIMPAFVFDPVLPQEREKIQTERKPIRVSPLAANDPAKSYKPTGRAPKDLEEVCYWNVRQLAELVRTKRVSSSDLTAMYLGRLKRLNAELHCVITLTEERAKAQAAEADKEIAAGKYRGPLHGLPWGAKDLLAVKGYNTTWGAGGFEQQSFDYDSTVVERLDHAGAVLIAKLTLGALAMGDKWFGGMTRNPWSLEQGSSGSSAGSASATSAGCVAFAIGTETLGSISSPSTRCGTTGLRPTFGFVPRTGAMALSWTMDKIGPICRSVEDTAIVLNAIYGFDGKDGSMLHNAAFNWDGPAAAINWKSLRIGYFKDEFDVKPPSPEQAVKEETNLSPEAKQEREKQAQLRADSFKSRQYDNQFNLAALEKLRSMGVNLIEVTLPKLPYQAVTPVLQAEGAAAFDELTRSGRDKLLTQQGPHDWPNVFRVARFYPAVEYVNAMRARTMIMQQWAELFCKVDVIVSPTFSSQLAATNLTGHPALILPNGFRGADAPPAYKSPSGDVSGGPGTPLSLTFLGPLFGEPKLLAVARAYQEATDFHRQHPKL
jgi:Asp-tRNA(Asn)/Glu-tRNA(Gln) amidotransferase A subunit family amidase